MTLNVINSCGCLSHMPTERAICLCSGTDVVRTLGRKYALAILSIVGNHPNIRFQELKDRLGDVSSSTLTIRLTELERAGLIARSVYPEIPPRVEYSLTQAGSALREKLRAIQDSLVAR